MPSEDPHIITFSALPVSHPTARTLTPEADTLSEIAQTLDLSALRKVRFEVSLAPMGKRDWHLTGRLGATVVQPCTLTLAPVTTRIEDTVERFYLADLPEPESTEVEMPEDDRQEPLPATLNLIDVMTEALALALPEYPRAEGAALETQVFTEPGKAPMTDEDAKPFAGLAALKDKFS